MGLGLELGWGLRVRVGVGVRSQRGLLRARVVDVLTKKDLVDLRPEGGAVAVLLACSGDVRVTTDRLV